MKRTFYKNAEDEAEHILKIIPREAPEINQQIRKWVNHYLFYDKKKGKAVCSWCGNEFNLKDVRDYKFVHKEKAVCPMCGCHIEKRSAGYGRRSIEDHMRIGYWTRVGRTIYLIIEYVDIDYEFDIPHITKVPRAIYVYGKENPYMLKNYMWNGWEKKKASYINESVGLFYYQCPKYGDDIYFRNTMTSELLKGSYMEYVPSAWFRRKTQNTIEMYADIGFLNLFFKYPAVEVLAKSGFENLVEERIMHERCAALNWTKSDIRKIFRADKGEIRKIREANLTLAELAIRRRIIKYGDYIEPAFIKELNTYAIWDIDHIEKNTSIYKAVEYLKKQSREDIYAGGMLNDYDDYLQQCELLNYDLNRKDILFPKEFYKAHEKASAAMDKIRDEAASKNFITSLEKVIPRDYVYEKDGYIIRPARSPGELRREGSSLGHCVGGYSQRVADGNSIIMFVRKAECPAKPFVTMEIFPNLSFVQIRAKSNRDPADDVKAFAHEWLESYKKEQKKILKKQKVKVAA